MLMQVAVDNPPYSRRQSILSTLCFGKIPREDRSQMKSRNRKIGALFVIGLTLFGNVIAQKNINIIKGQNGWLFLDLPMSGPETYARTANVVSAVDTILKYKGISMVFAAAPMPQHIYPENLPDGYHIDKTFDGLYQNFNKALTSQGVNAPNILQEFFNLKKSNLPDLLYFPHDYHWSEIGGLEAAKIVAKSINGIAAYKSVLPPVKFLLRVLPPAPLKDRLFLANHISNSDKMSWQANFKYMSVPISVERPKSQDDDLLGGDAPDIALVGTSYSDNNKGFAPSLPYALQKDVVDAHRGGAGPWVPLMDYATSDAYQNEPPKVLVWEFPELELPIYMPGTDIGSLRMWTSRIAPYIAGDCSKMDTEVNASSKSLAAFNQNISSKSSKSAINISLDADYIALDVVSHGEKEMKVGFTDGKFFSNQTVPLIDDYRKRTIYININGEDLKHADSIAFSIIGGGNVVISNAKACRLPKLILDKIRAIK